MKEKSRFVTFILSFVPGLSHFYLGYADRGIIYLIIFGMLVMGTVGIAQIFYSGGAEAIGVIGICILWLVALLDALSVLNILRYQGPAAREAWNSEETKISNKRIISLALSLIPGVGHMYLGYQKKGLLYMGGFFFTIFFMGWLNMSFLLFLLPLLWFYSFFDVFHTINENYVEDLDLGSILPSIRHEHIGKGLIVLGIIILLRKILYPVIEELLASLFQYQIIYEIRNYIQALIVAIVFILGGIRILKGNKTPKYMNSIGEGEDIDED